MMRHTRLNKTQFNTQSMSRRKKIAIWVGIIGGGIAYWVAYGYIADAMR